MIRDYNCDPDYSQFARKLVTIDVSEGASVAGLPAGGFRSEMAGTIMSAIFRCLAITDADDSARVDVAKNGTSILSAAVDPVAINTTTTFTLTSYDLADGDIITGVVTTGAGDVLRGFFQFEIRPDLGSYELASPIDNA